MAMDAMAGAPPQRWREQLSGCVASLWGECRAEQKIPGFNAAEDSRGESARPWRTRVLTPEVG
jgi:hypothetical protein